jgi:hypothetical protein
MAKNIMKAENWHQAKWRYREGISMAAAARAYQRHRRRVVAARGWRKAKKKKNRIGNRREMAQPAGHAG